MSRDTSIGPGPLEIAIMKQVKPKQFLLVDDSEDDKQLIEDFSSRYNCVWTWARDYDAAVSEVRKHPARFFKLIFLDLKLGSYDDCVRTFAYLKRAKAGPVVIISGQDDLSARRQLREVGFYSFIEKPTHFTPEYFEDVFETYDVPLKPDPTRMEVQDG
jgi:CheY-like chemotaxis protein